jgi:hypothetical protein
MVFTKTLIFTFKNLPADTSVLLCFNDPSPSILGGQQGPLAWKVLVMRKGQMGATPVTFTSQLAFGQSTLDSQNVVEGNIWVPIDEGQIVSLMPNEVAGNGPLFGPPAAHPEINTLITASNDSGAIENMSVGFMNGDNYEPTFIWMDVGAGTSVEAQYHPILKAYVTSQYKEAQFLTADLMTMAPIWTQNLSDLPTETTKFSFNRDPATGRYTITQL